MNNVVSIILSIVVVFVIGGVLGVCISLADKYLKVEEDPRIEEVTKLLAGANCGGCGTAGCANFAEKVVSGEITSLNGCRPTSASNKEKIKEYLANTKGPNGQTINLK